LDLSDLLHLLVFAELLLELLGLSHSLLLHLELLLHL
jgi:hypothetical protein